jgi:hypothetical protein
MHSLELTRKGSFFDTKSFCRSCLKKRQAGALQTFTTYSSSVWKRYPKDVHAHYEDYVSNLEAGYSDTWYSTGFCDLLIFNEGGLQAFAD